MRRDLNRFRHRRRKRLQLTIVFAAAVLGALVLVAMRSCTERLDGMYQGSGSPASPSLDQHDKERLKKLLEKGGGH